MSTPGLRHAAVVVALVALVTLVPVACVAGDPGDSADGGDGGDGKAFSPGPTLTGNYLSGRHAQAIHDPSMAADFLDATLAMDPGSTDLLGRTFVLMAVDGRMERAMELARDVVAVNPKAPLASLAVMVDDIKAERLSEVEERLAGLEVEGLNIFLVPLLRGWTKVGLGEGAEAALAALEPLSDNDRSKPLYNLHAALVNELAGRVEAAEKSYQATIDSQGGLSLRLVQLFGAFYERSGQPDKAQALYREYLEANPGSRLLEPALARLESGRTPEAEVVTAADGVAEGLYGLAGSLRIQNARETALMFGRLAIHLRPRFPALQVLVADVLESEARLEEANAVYSAIDPASPYWWSARLRTADNLDDLDRAEEAENHLRAMSAAHPGEAEPLIRLGDILRRRDRHPEAIEAYDQAEARIGQLEPRHWTLLYSRGISLERSDQWPRAEADFLKALEFEPDQPFVLNYLGYSWIDQGLHLERAREMIRKAVELRPTDGYIVDSLGWVLYRMGDFENATLEMERAIELLPEDPIINDHLGDVYWRVGRRQEARFQWLRALTLDPEPDLVEGVKAKLENGLEDQAETVGDD